MIGWKYRDKYQLHILETPEQMTWVENLQRKVWSGNDTEIVPGHLLLTTVHNGGLLIGAFKLDQEGSPPVWMETNNNLEENLVGFVFSFPGFQSFQDKIKLKHCSHLLAVLPEHENFGIGFALKRAQWQMVRRQNIEWVTWTFDPLLSRNAHLNIQKLGAVCNTYLPDYYGELRDELNRGQQTDRFQVDWWLNSTRVISRLSRKPRNKLDLAHYLAAEVKIVNPTQLNVIGLPQPVSISNFQWRQAKEQIVLVEIPAEFNKLKTTDPALASDWRVHSREIFSSLFSAGYIVADFIHLPGSFPRSFYALSYGESTL